MQHLKTNDTTTIVGVFCEVRRVKGGNKLWVLYFAGVFIGQYRTKSKALQTAAHVIQSQLQLITGAPNA